MKPMLAAPVDLKILRYPVYASPKLDGIRALIINGVVVGRSLKPIPNKHVQSLFGKSEYEGLDGELIFGPPTAPDVFNKTSSAVMTIEGTLPVKFYTFDYIGTPLFEYSERLKVVQTVENEHVFPVKHSLCFTEEDLLIIEQRRLDEGYEGLILRSMTGAYKYGRSTAREQGMLKMKRFTDDEAVIIGFEELMHNANEAKINELGHTERSSHNKSVQCDRHNDDSAELAAPGPSASISDQA